MNRVNLIGNIGTVIYDNGLDSSQACLVVSLATSEKWIDKSNNEVVKTSWHKVTIFGKTAVSARAVMVKGRRVFVDGQLRYSEYEDKEGVKQLSVDIVCKSYLATNI